MSFPAYPEYKDSGVAWLGEVPSHWDVVPLWTLFRRTKRTGFPDEELLSVYRDYGVLVTSSRDDNFNKASEDLGVYQFVNQGDLVINKMKAWQGSVGISGFRGIVSPAYFVFEPLHSMSSRYLHFLFRSEVYFSVYMAMSKGIRINQWDLDPQSHSRLSVLLPPRAEQGAIAAFLDHETAKIDALIAEQEKLIELLKEKRQAVISQAVTKGLDPTVPMKDSGVEWLGQVPEHWDVGQLRKYAYVLRGKFSHRPRNDPEYYGGDYPFIQTGDITSSGKYITSFRQTLNDKGAEVSVKFEKGTLVMAISANIGDVAILDFSAYLPDSIVGIFCNECADISFVYYEMQVLKSAMLMSATISTQMNLNVEKIVPLLGNYPPVNEQIEIARYLDGETTKIDELLNQTRIAITLLKERRSTLISAAVTGKIDVRGYAPQQEAV